MYFSDTRQERQNKLDQNRLAGKNLPKQKEHCLLNKSPISPIEHTPNVSECNNQKPADKLLATFVNQMVASAFELSADDLMRANRGNARASRARQISIYLMHTALSFSLSKIAIIYQKDRTTVGYACRVIEDLRDGPAFDDRILELEETVKTVLKLSAYIPTKGGRSEK